MDVKKSWVYTSILSLFTLFVTSCAPGGAFPNIWQKILDIGSLKFLGIAGGNGLVAFVRILIALLIFAILFEVGRRVLNRNTAGIISGILAIISAIFIPGSILAGIGGAYATFFSIALIGLPVVGGLYLIWRIPGTSRGGIALRIVILTILLWILMGVRTHALAII
ncbi:MAG: hypothetical protein CMH61_01335 [Nanoarchaeota archaeon]|mgnify:CR=1 FL=1|nr:hypothetical protein [Nanoarchaeota archaeon]|tara:strand:- start:940 stop:1437 length:498 start_codon:yes stop_codon:yes gene_type:complete